MDNLHLLKNLAASCKACISCNLSQGRSNVVFGSGSPTARIMVVGEAPGESEDLSATPFVGVSGRLLTTLFKSAGFSREDDLFITNTVKCRPPDNRNPLPEEIAACDTWLTQQIQIIRPSIIVLVGKISAEAYLGRPFKITKERGEWLSSNPHVMAILHPSYLLRNQQTGPGSPIQQTLQDLQKVHQRYQDVLSIGTSLSLTTKHETFWNELDLLP